MVYFGDVLALPEQGKDESNITVVATLDILSGREGTLLTVSIVTTYLSDGVVKTLLDTKTFSVVRPHLQAVASVAPR